MSTPHSNRKPTDAELAILGVIWERGTATVRQVFNELGPRQHIGYTTVLKLMQIMTDKGLLQRDATVKPQAYSASRPRKQTQRLLLHDLLDRAFAGSPGNLVLHALSMRKTSPEELQQIRALLDEIERSQA